MTMRNCNISFSLPVSLLAVALLAFSGCNKREIDGLQKPSFPTMAEVFIDDFTSDLAYAAFGTSDVRAFNVDDQVGYNKSRQSMRFDVPDANSPTGSYAGGVFLSKTGRDLSGYNALTFYIKASQAANIGTLGFGNDFGENKYQVTLNNLAVNSNWKKVIIPIPDPSKLVAEKGLFYYATGPINDKGYTFWIDEVKYEKLSDIGTITSSILNGEDRVVASTETGEEFTIDGLIATVNMPNGINQNVNISPSYFTFLSSNTRVASVNSFGMVSVNDSGTAIITAEINNKPVKGSIRLTSTGAPLLPTAPAPDPTRDPANVISLYSNVYSSVPVNTWNTRWLYSTAENNFIQIAGNDAIRYRNLNFVGIEFSNPVINASSMQFFHIDIWTPNPTAAPNNFKILLIDFGTNGEFGGGDDVQHEVTITAPTLSSNQWVGIDLPLSAFTGLTSRSHLAQMVLSGTLPNVIIDNVYFYKNASNPIGPAPVPTRPAANVLSVFSDSYTNLSGTNFNPNWGQSTVMTQLPISGNNTLRFANFNYQGIQLSGNQDVSSYGYLHIDYYSSNASALNVYLISPGPVEKAVPLNVPTAGWNSIDIPLSSFSPVNLSNLFQFKFDGTAGSEIYLDNIYFYK